MQDIANERGLAPFVVADDDSAAGPPDRRKVALRGKAPVFGQLSDARRLVDGLGGLGWTAVGFLLGAIFWHFVGFWGFISDVVLAGNPAGTVASGPARMYTSPERGQWVQTAEVTPSQRPCIALHLDRATGQTSAVACDARSEAAFATDAFEGREDRVPVARSGVAPHSSPHASGAN